MQPDLTKAHCNVCGGVKNHFILFEHKKKWKEHFGDHPSAFIYGEDRYETLQCAGCDRVCMRHTELFSENTDEEGRQIPEISYYPPQTIRKTPSWMTGTEGLIFIGRLDFIPRLIRQVYIALHSQCYDIAAMGIRALLELMIIDCVGDKGSFAANVQEFENQGHLGKKQKEVIDTTLDLGSAAIHRNFSPSKKDVLLTLDITENIIQMTYIDNRKATDLRKRIPPRKKKT